MHLLEDFPEIEGIAQTDMAAQMRAAAYLAKSGPPEDLVAAIRASVAKT